MLACGSSYKRSAVELHIVHNHITPWSKGGEATENLQTLCSICNFSKVVYK